MANGRFEFKLSPSDGDVGYLYLPDHPGDGQSGIVAKQVRLTELYPDYKGADVYLDFDKDNRLVGIEVLA